MPRRKQQHLIPPGLMLQLAIAAAGLWLVGVALSELPKILPVLGYVGLSAAGVVALVFATKMVLRRRAARGDAETINRPLKSIPSLSVDTTPAEFEIYCATQLREAGWTANVTKGSHDQGVDVIAEKNGIRVALQCKMHGRPIGNKAVMEVTAGKLHSRAQFAAVVSNRSYTVDAEQLARSTSVMLLHYRQLGELDQLVDAGPKAKAVG